MVDTPGAAAGSGLPDERVDEIEAFLDEWTDRTDVPGVSVAVCDRDGLLYAGGLGARRVDPTAPATAETLYYVGSITKVATAAAVLQLVDRGALALEDAVADRVPFLRDVPGDPVTVGELLTHSSGMPTDFVARRDDVADTDDLRRHVDGAAQWRVTGERRFMYYNGGYKVLGELVAAVDGRPFAEYVGAELLSPLGMERSTFDQSRMAADADAMTGYETVDGERVAGDGTIDFESQVADGGLIAPVTELTRLLRCVLNGGELDGTRILDPGTAESMCESRVTKEVTVDGRETGYGYGLMVAPFAGDTLVGHGGATDRSHAYLGGCRESGLGVALGFNATDVPQDAVGQGVLALAAGEPPREVVPALSLRAKCEAVAGTYEAYRGAETATVTAARGHLTVTFEGWEMELPAFPESVDPDDYTFYTVRSRGQRDPIEFREDDGRMCLLWDRSRLQRTG